MAKTTADSTKLKNLWFDADGKQFFLLPDGFEPPPGDLEVFNQDGDTLSIDPAALADRSISQEEADRILEEEMAPIAARVQDAVQDATKRIFEVAPGVAESIGRAEVRDEEDPAVAFGRMLRLDPEAIRARPELVTEELQRILEKIEGVGKDLGVVADAPGAAGGSTGQLAGDAMERVQADAQGLLERIGLWLAKHLPERQRDLGDVHGVADLVAWALDAPPAEETEEQRDARYRADVRAEIDKAFKGFQLPSFRFDDLLHKKPQPKASDGGETQDVEKTSD